MEKQLHTLEVLLEALEASQLALRRDACSDQAINGRAGHIYASGDNFLIYASPLSSRPQAALIRYAIRLKRRRHLSPHTRAVARSNLMRANAALRRGLNDQNRGSGRGGVGRVAPKP